MALPDEQQRDPKKLREAAGVNQAPGTRFGNFLRRSAKSAINEGVRESNAGSKRIAATANALSYPMRAAGGFLTDTARGLVGASPRANAGHPVGTLTAPHYDMPFDDPSLKSSDMPAQQPSVPRITPSPVAAVPQIAAPDIQTKDAAPTPVLARTGGVNIGDRHLNYGADVNGVPTFSDGSNGIARTISEQQIKDLGQQLQTVPHSTTALASDALGHTPTSEEMVQQNMRLQPPASRQISPALQQMFADSQANAIASGDWRSAAGTTAHNLQVDETSGTPRQRRTAETQLAQLQRGAQQRAQTAATEAGANERTRTQELGATQRRQTADAAAAVQGQLNRQAQLNRTNIEQGGANRRAGMSRRPQTVTLADGTLGEIVPGGGVVQARGADGKPVKVLQPKAGPAQERTFAVKDNLAKTAAQLLKQSQLSNTPLTVKQARVQAAQLQGLRTGVDSKGHPVAMINGKMERL